MHGARIHYPKFDCLCLTCGAKTVLTLTNPEAWPASNTPPQQYLRLLSKLTYTYICTLTPAHVHDACSYETNGGTF